MFTVESKKLLPIQVKLLLTLTKSNIVDIETSDIELLSNLIFTKIYTSQVLILLFGSLFCKIIGLTPVT